MEETQIQAQILTQDMPARSVTVPRTGVVGETRPQWFGFDRDRKDIVGIKLQTLPASLQAVYLNVNGFHVLEFPRFVLEDCFAKGKSLLEDVLLPGSVLPTSTVFFCNVGLSYEFLLEGLPVIECSVERAYVSDTCELCSGSGCVKTHMVLEHFKQVELPPLRIEYVVRSSDAVCEAVKTVKKLPVKKLLCAPLPLPEWFVQGFAPVNAAEVYSGCAGHNVAPEGKQWVIVDDAITFSGGCLAGVGHTFAF